MGGVLARGLIALVGSCIFTAGCLLPGVSTFDPTPDSKSESPMVGGGSSTVTVSQERACNDGKAFAKAQCDRAHRCGSNDGYWWGWGAGGVQCEHSVASWYVTLFTLSSADERVKACQKELESPSCGATPACAELNRTKRREKGVECSTNTDCKVGLACISDVCTDRKAEGGKCSHSDECTDGLSCQESACKPVIEGTSACRYTEDCQVTRDSGSGLFWGFGRDTDKFYCDDSTLKCKSVVRDRKQGETCGEGRLCVAGFFCKGRLLNGEGLCTPQIKFGEKCEDGEGCYSCRNGICQDPLADTCK